MLLPIAALVIALGGTILTLRKPTSDPVAQTQIPSNISVQPDDTLTVFALSFFTHVLSSTTFYFFFYSI